MNRNPMWHPILSRKFDLQSLSHDRSSAKQVIADPLHKPDTAGLGNRYRRAHPHSSIPCRFCLAQDTGIETVLRDRHPRTLCTALLNFKDATKGPQEAPEESCIFPRSPGVRLSCPARYSAGARTGGPGTGIRTPGYKERTGIHGSCQGWLSVWRGLPNLAGRFGLILCARTEGGWRPQNLPYLPGQQLHRERLLNKCVTPDTVVAGSC
jgi:hypothetical protein